MKNSIALKTLSAKIYLRVKTTWLDCLCASCSAGLSWFVSANLFSHQHPVFAAVSGLICLLPGLPSYARHSFYVCIGVFVGVIVGETALLLPEIPTCLRIAEFCFIAILIASSYARMPVFIAQAGVSSIMVFAMGPQYAGVTRLLDVAVGASVALIFSQILFTKNQLKMLNLAAERFYTECGFILQKAYHALENRNLSAAENCLDSSTRMNAMLKNVLEYVNIVDDHSKWTIRGRLEAHKVSLVAKSYDKTTLKLYAYLLLFSDAMVRALRLNNEGDIDLLLIMVKNAAESCFMIANSIGKYQELSQDSLQEKFTLPDNINSSGSWNDCIYALQMILYNLYRMQRKLFKLNKIMITLRANKVKHV